jgi:exopolyphosphatase / guanosine-5'-triphosphate,3'-diphosphate pyrophosphatase
LRGRFSSAITSPSKSTAALLVAEIQTANRNMEAANAMLAEKHEHNHLMQDGTLLAAIDLGSNSFRLEVGRLDHGHVQRVEYIKETVRQGNGLDSERNLSPEAMQRGWDCLARFSERLKGFKRGQVRAVATQTLREARNRDVFIAKANQLLGFPIDVISGREEARLIYLGVAHLLPQSNEKRLVIDIGGRSTELILGQGYASQRMESYRLGSVAWSMKYFDNGRLLAVNFERAQVAAQAILDEAFGPAHWEIAYGSSGTVGAVADILTAKGYPAGSVTREGLQWLYESLLRAGHIDKVDLVGLKEDRRAVIGGGVAILRSLFDLLDIQELFAAEGALRHGLLFDLVDREDAGSDVRSTSVTRLATKFAVDTAHSERVAATTAHFLSNLVQDAPKAHQERLLRKARWAAQVHEIGARISHTDYHKHGAYILDNADAPGFAQSELHRLSLLVYGHRGKLKKLNDTLDDADFMRQLLALRLAVIICHARRAPDLQGLSLHSSGTGFHLQASLAWQKAYPQSAHLLQEEVSAWQKISVDLRIGGKT